MISSVRARQLMASAVILGGLLPAACPAAEEAGTLAAVVDRAFRPMMTRYDVPGIAVAVTVDGRSSVFTYGVASKESGAPVTTDTLFEIGSVSKTFTATLVTYAQALGKLSLDDRPGEFVPQLRGSAVDRANLLHLGTYTAGGLPLQFPREVRDDAAMVAYFRRWTPSAAPGAQRRYSNPSIGLLGHVAARALGGDFADLMEKEIFPGLGLADSYIRVPEAAMGRYARGYDRAGRPVRVNPGVFAAEAYGVKSSAADMIRLVEAHLRPEALDGPIRRALEGTRIGHVRVGGMVQGLGWEQYPYPVPLDRLLEGNSAAMATQPQAATPVAPPQAPAGPTLFNKTGSTNGFGAYVAFVPEKRIGIVMLANRNVPVPARIAAAHAVLERLSGPDGREGAQR